MTQLRNLGTAVFKWRPGRLAQHGGALLGWMMLRAAAQAGTVVLLARAMGATAYGQVVAILATASLVVSFAGLGLSHIVLRNAARAGQVVQNLFNRCAIIEAAPRGYHVDVSTKFASFNENGHHHRYRRLGQRLSGQVPAGQYL